MKGTIDIPKVVTKRMLRYPQYANGEADGRNDRGYCQTNSRIFTLP